MAECECECENEHINKYWLINAKAIHTMRWSGRATSAYSLYYTFCDVVVVSLYILFPFLSHNFIIYIYFVYIFTVAAVAFFLCMLLSMADACNSCTSAVQKSPCFYRLRVLICWILYWFCKIQIHCIAFISNLVRFTWDKCLFSEWNVYSSWRKCKEINRKNSNQIGNEIFLKALVSVLTFWITDLRWRWMCFVWNVLNF